MLPNDELHRFGEPPTDFAEMALADTLGELLDRGDDEPLLESTQSFYRASPDMRQLVAVCRRIEEMMGTILERTGAIEELDEPQVEQVQLRICVSRMERGIAYPVASSHPKGMALRDLRKVPEEVDRVSLRTGQRVRVDVVCDRGGYLTVFNLGPTGNLNLLHPLTAEHQPTKAREVLQVANVELTPPAGRERLYALWSRNPLAALARLRDMKRVQETLGELPLDDWHAVVMELEHRESD